MGRNGDARLEMFAIGPNLFAFGKTPAVGLNLDGRLEVFAVGDAPPDPRALRPAEPAPPAS